MTLLSFILVSIKFIDNLPIYIAIISLVLFLMKIKNNAKEEKWDMFSKIFITLFITVCIMEILFCIFSNPIRIFAPDIVGWGMAIVNFILLGIICFTQISVFIVLMNSIATKANRTYDLTVGLLSWVGGLIFLFLATFFYEPAIKFIVGIIILMQIIQIVIIFKCITNQTKTAILFSIIYLLGSFATFLIVANFLALAFIIIFGIVLLYIISKLTNHSDTTSTEYGKENPDGNCICGSCKNYSSQTRYCQYTNRHVMDYTRCKCIYYRS